ncbi:MAG: ClpX C4-type zinc finger protein [Rhodospirillales bacterium]|nr:ClpX C4-type zinc finger protein [Rhodospirillales bacterium]MDH3970174.1 ClpX C4-type zinc finger protein [Rhodospirillales bacterium]
MEMPPPILDCAKVLAYAAVDESVVHVRDNPVYVDGKPLGAVPNLAICKYPIEDEHLLFFCRKEWEVLGCTGCPSLEAAKDRAEREYRGIAARWQSYHHEDEAAVDRQCLEPFCSFCGKSFFELERLIWGKDGAVICDGCVRTLAAALNGSS